MVSGGRGDADGTNPAVGWEPGGSAEDDGGARAAVDDDLGRAEGRRRMMEFDAEASVEATHEHGGHDVLVI